MPDYLNMPRQHGLSPDPVYARNPRKFARDRCDKGISSADKLILYMLELISIYMPDEMSADEAYKHGIALVDYAIENRLDLSDLVDISIKAEIELGELGKFAGYIAVAALIIRSTKDLQDIVKDLKLSI